MIRQEEAQDSPSPGSWRQLVQLGGRPTTLVGRRHSGPHRLKPLIWHLVIGSPWRFLEEEAVAPSYKYKGVEIRTHTSHYLKCILAYSIGLAEFRRSLGVIESPKLLGSSSMGSSLALSCNIRSFIIELDYGYLYLLVTR